MEEKNPLSDHITQGLRWARLVNSRAANLYKVREELAYRLLDIRSEIILPSTGEPDWKGESGEYKQAISPIIAAAHYDGGGDAIVKTYNEVNRVVMRLLPAYVAAYHGRKMPDPPDMSGA